MPPILEQGLKYLIIETTHLNGQAEKKKRSALNQLSLQSKHGSEFKIRAVFKIPPLFGGLDGLSDTVMFYTGGDLSFCLYYSSIWWSGLLVSP